MATVTTLATVTTVTSKQHLLVMIQASTEAGIQGRRGAAITLFEVFRYPLFSGVTVMAGHWTCKPACCFMRSWATP